MPATAVQAAVPQESGPFWPGNLLSMNNADFENGVGDWQGSSNVAPLTTASTAFLHNSALKIVATGPGTSIIKLSSASGIEIDLPGTGIVRTFRVGAYINMQSMNSHTTEFDLGCYDSSGTWIGWEHGSPVSNITDGNWHWVEDDIMVPSNCTSVRGSPQVQFTGMYSGGTIYMDEAWFAPERAALMVGAYQTGNITWESANSSIGPLQSEKMFYDASTDFPSTWSNSANTCYNIENDPTRNSPLPVCLIAFMKQENESQIKDFLASMPTDQTVIFIYHQEPEGDSFPSPLGSCDPGGDSVHEFLCEFKAEVGNIRTAAASDGLTENVFTADDSASYQYVDDGAGMHPTPCGWIVPAGYADFYLQDHYERGWADGTNLSVQGSSSNGEQEWNNWLGCVDTYANTLDKPIGLAEYGLCSGGADCNSGSQSCGDAGTTSLDEATMAADHDYLESEPTGTSPTLLWEYWYANCWKFDNTHGMITEWQSIENENGGAVGD